MSRSRKVTYKLNAQETAACVKFAADVGMELNQLAKRSLFYALTNAYRSATSGPLGGKSDALQTGAGVDQAVTEATPGSTDVDSNQVAGPQTDADSTK